ncbi:MAG: hypothetical protein NUV67_04590 [archaeon]|nr:hypothetical protein [archaeon]
MKIELSNFTGQPCKSRMAYEFLPNKEYSLNLEKTANALREQEVFIELESDYLLMLKMQGHDISLFRSGKIIVKAINDKEKARNIAQNLVKKLG